MSVKRQTYSAEFKSQVALEAVKEERTINEIAISCSIHPQLVKQWKKLAQDNLGVVFTDKRLKASKEKDDEALNNQLYQQIGQLKFELDWLKKRLVISVSQRRVLVEPGYKLLSVTRQLELLGLSWYGYYYKARPVCGADVLLMNRIDELYTECPFYGAHKIQAVLNREGCSVGRRHLIRLMRKMALFAIYQKPKTSVPCPEHKTYAYLLRGIISFEIDEVWSCDITYIRLTDGFVYLVAVIDWASRFVLSWLLSNTLDTQFCATALRMALASGKPEIFNTDQGSQFTNIEFTSILEADGVRISMDVRGRTGQHLYRTILANHQVRTGLPE